MASNEQELLEEDDVEVPEYCCTVVSLLPYELSEDKPHMLPSTFKVPPASMDGLRFGILHVKEGIHWIPNPLIDEGKPGSSIKQVTPPSEMARSICEDYNSAHVALTDNASPGLFWVPGKLTQDDVEKFHRRKIQAARERQKNWFKNLCMMADADWEKNHNMLAVSDLQRIAAKSLGVNKEWVEFKVEEMNKCPFCKISVSSDASKCSNCGEIINPTLYAQQKKAFDPTSLFEGSVSNA